MRRFLTYTLLLALAVVITLAVGELLLRQVPNTYSYKDTWMRQHHRHVKTLILGNSLTLEGINPKLLGEDAFNLANVAQTMEQDWYLLQHYAPYDSLRTVILALSENLVYAELEQVPSLAVRSSYYQMYMGCHKHPWWSSYNYELARLDVSWAKWKAYLQLRAQGRVVACDSLGFAPELLERRSSQWRQDGQGTHWNQYADPEGNVRRNLEYLNQIVQFCNTHDVSLILVSPPLYIRCDSLTQQAYHSAGCRLIGRGSADYLDFTSDSRFGEDDFFDAHHLNALGADKFTQILMAECHAISGSLVRKER